MFLCPKERPVGTVKIRLIKKIPWVCQSVRLPSLRCIPKSSFNSLKILVSDFGNGLFGLMENAKPIASPDFGYGS